ncbi:MAG TPA: FeoB-associated Cys-rich membrane protein [Anaerolineaceae bacterium]|nr:FeoB-associated Cys-rich membrane protein [Anaerolineaceae bacterium]
MVPTIIISGILVAIVGLIIYRLIRDARAGRGGCAGCSYADTCAAAKILPKKSDCGCPEQQKPVR